jgi:protein phosphatase PTC2/3
MILGGSIHILLNQGDIAAKLTADFLHKRLISDESYKDKQYEIALKRAFLGTDDDLRASEFRSSPNWH